MLKRHFFFLPIIFLALTGFSQNEPDTLVTAEIPYCEAVARNSAGFVMYYFARQDPDSAEIVLSDWEAACGISEPILRTRILLAIYQNEFNESLYDSTIIDCIYDYAQRMKSDSNSYNSFPAYYGFVPVKGEYDYFTQSLADTMLKWTFYNPAELYFTKLYANVLESVFKEIQYDTIYIYTGLKSYYDKRVNTYRLKPDYNFGFHTGIWIPSDHAALLGNHPVLGFQAGIRMQKMTYNLSMSIRMGKSKNDYTILLEDSLYTTRTFTGLYLGADIERDMFRWRKNEFDLLAGFGYDGISAVNVNTEDDDLANDVSYSINSVNINFGLGYRHYFREKRYVAIQGKYNFVNYNNKGGTNLAGNCITISLIAGGYMNQQKDYFLNKLEYNE